MSISTVILTSPVAAGIDEHGVVVLVPHRVELRWRSKRLSIRCVSLLSPIGASWFLNGLYRLKFGIEMKWFGKEFSRLFSDCPRVSLESGRNDKIDPNSQRTTRLFEVRATDWIVATAGSPGRCTNEYQLAYLILTGDPHNTPVERIQPTVPSRKQYLPL